MEKVKFGTHEFDLVPMGNTADDIKKTRSIQFISDMGMNDVFGIVTNPENYNLIEIIGQDGNPQNVYTDIAAFKHIGYTKDVEIDQGTTADVYTVTYSVDAVEKELSNLSNQLTVARSEIGSLNTQIDDLSNTIVIISMSGL